MVSTVHRAEHQSAFMDVGPWEQSTASVLVRSQALILKVLCPRSVVLSSSLSKGKGFSHVDTFFLVFLSGERCLKRAQSDGF